MGCFRKTHINQVFIAHPYKGVVRKLVSASKFGRSRQACRFIAEATEQALPGYFLCQPVVIPVPTSRSSVRSRGLDHSLIVAKLVAYRRRYPLKTKLRHAKKPSFQASLTRTERLKSQVGSMVFQGSLEGKTVLLYDDVLTTGATITEAARAVRAAGASNIIALIFARTSK